MTRTPLEELQERERIVREEVNEYDQAVVVARNIAEQQNKKSTLQLEINKYLTQDRPEAGTIKRMTSVLGGLSGVNAIYQANEAAILKATENANAAPMEFVKTFVSQYAKDIGKNVLTAATGKDYTQGNKTYKDIMSKQMGLADTTGMSESMAKLNNFGLTAAGVLGDITIDANIVGGLKPFFSTIQYLGKSGINLAKQIPMLEKGMDTIAESFNIFHNIEKTQTPAIVEKFKNAFRPAVATRDFTKLDEMGINVSGFSNQFGTPANRLRDASGRFISSRPFDNVLDTAFTPGAKDPTSQVGKFLDKYAGTALEKTNEIFKTVLSWSLKFQTRNAMGGVTQNIGEGVGLGSYWDALKLLTTGKGTAKYTQLQETGVLSQPGMFGQVAGQGGQTSSTVGKIWQGIKDIPATVATWGESLNRTALIFKETSKGTPFLKAVEKSENVFYKYASEYLTPFEESLQKVFPFLKFQIGQAGYFPGKLNTVGGQAYYAGMGKIKDATSPDETKDYPGLTSKWFKDMFTVGSVGNIGFQAEDFFKNITGNVQNIWGQVAPLLKTMTEGVTNYKVFADKKMSTDTEGRKYAGLSNFPIVGPAIQAMVGYDQNQKTANPIMKWLTDTWVGPIIDGLTTAFDPKKGPLRAIFSIREYDTGLTGSLRQSEMDRREKEKDKSGWNIFDQAGMGNVFDYTEANAGMPPEAKKGSLEKWQSDLRKSWIKDLKGRGGFDWVDESTYDTKLVRSNAPGEQRMDFDIRSRMWDDMAKALLTAGPDIGKNIAASHGATLEAMMKKADFYGFLNHPDFQKLLSATKESQAFLAPREIGSKPAFGPEDIKFRKMLTGNYAQDYNKMIEDVIAFTSKTAERWRASFVKSPQSIQRGIQADMDAAVTQYRSGLGGISKEQFKSRIDALTAEYNHALDDLAAKSHTATANILETWADAEVEGIRKIEIQRQAALEKYKGSEEYRRALAAEDYEQTARMFAGIDRKYEEQKRNRIAYESKILAQTNAAMLKDEGAAIVAALQDAFKRGGMSISEFYGKQLKQVTEQHTKSAIDAIDMFMKYMKPPAGMSFPKPQEPDYEGNVRKRTSIMAAVHPDFKPFISEATIRAVTDGDSVIVAMPDGSLREIRLANADAPEVAHPDVKGQEHWKGQPFGAEATEGLREMLPVGTKVTIDVATLDKYKRNIANIIVDNVDVNLAMVEKGLAAMYAQYFEDPKLFKKYLDAQKMAQEQKRGMWTQDPTTFEASDKYRQRMESERPGFNYKVKRMEGKMPTKDSVDAIKEKVRVVSEGVQTYDEIIKALTDTKIFQEAEQLGVVIELSTKKTVIQDPEKVKTAAEAVSKEITNFQAIYENFGKLKKSLEKADPAEQMEVMKTVFELMRKAIPLGNFEELNQAMKMMYEHYQAVAKAIPDTEKAVYEANKKFQEATFEIRQKTAEIMREVYSTSTQFTLGVTATPASGGTTYGTIRKPGRPVGYNADEERKKAALEAFDQKAAEDMRGKDQGAMFQLPERGTSQGAEDYMIQAEESLQISRESLLNQMESEIDEEGFILEEREKLYQDNIQRIDDLLAQSAARNAQRNKLIVDNDEATAQKRLNVASGMADMLAQTASMLYEASGKKSKEMFYIMKAAEFASAAIKGYSAVMSAFKSGSDINVYVGVAYAAIAAAFVGAQLGLIAGTTIQGPGKAEGGRIDGGSGTRDDVPIMAMGGEYVIRKGSVQKYGENFMEALNKGLIRSVDIPNFAVEIPASNNMQTHFATGGMVAGKATVPQPEKEKEQNLQIVNVIDPALLDKYLSSTSGQRTLVNVMAANKYELRQVMR